MKRYDDMEIKEMYDRNIDRLYKIAYMFFRYDQGKIEDAIQDVFLKVIDKNIRFENLEHEKAWFIVALKNICKNVLKKKWNDEVELETEIQSIDVKDETIEKVLNLPEKYKLPIYLFYYEGYSCVEISKLMEVPENTIYSLMNRGRKILKLEIEEELR